MGQAEALVMLETRTSSIRAKVDTGGRPIPQQALAESGAFAKMKYLAYEAHIWTTIARPVVSSFKVIAINLREQHSQPSSVILERGVVCRPWTGTTIRVHIKDGDPVPNGYVVLAPFAWITADTYEKCIPYLLAELSNTADGQSGEYQGRPARE